MMVTRVNKRSHLLLFTVIPPVHSVIDSRLRAGHNLFFIVNVNEYICFAIYGALFLVSVEQKKAWPTRSATLSPMIRPAPGRAHHVSLLQPRQCFAICIFGSVFILVVAHGGIKELWTELSPAFRRDGTSIRYLWSNGQFLKANGTTVRYWMILVDSPWRYGSITNPRSVSTCNKRLCGKIRNPCSVSVRPSMS